MENMFWVYMLCCSDGSYYVGHTDQLEIRIAAHQAGSIGGYTKERRPIRLVFSQEFSSREEAFVMERRVKGWSRAKKEALIREDWEEIKRLSWRKGFAHPSTGSG